MAGPESTAEWLRRREREAYAASLGREAETKFPGDPDWEYRGRKAEREALEEHVGLSADVPIVIEGQEEMF